MSIALVAVGNEFIVTHVDAQGEQTALSLSEADVLSLAQSAESFRDHIVARHTPSGGGHPPVVTIPIARVGLNHTLLESDLLLSLFQTSGKEHLFSLPQQVAATLPEAVSNYLSAMNRTDDAVKH